jgi:hypothetical protein
MEPLCGESNSSSNKIDFFRFGCRGAASLDAEKAMAFGTFKGIDMRKMYDVYYHN